MKDLSPEERAIGKANYQTVSSDLLTRREFMQGTTAAVAVAGGGMGALYFGYKKLGGDPVRIGVIGTGDEGSVLIGAHNPEYVDIVAIADIRPYNIYRAFEGDQSSENAAVVRPGLMKKRGWKTRDEAEKHVKIYDKDYHDLLKDPDVEGVIIALPLHLHDVVAIEALRAGKHVLTEKLMGHSVRQCKEMGRVANQKKLHLATGHQRHYSILYDNAVDMIKRGMLGDLHHIRAQWHRGNVPGKDSWAQPLPDKLQKELDDLVKKMAAATTGDVDALMKRKKLLEEQVKDAVVDAGKYGYEEKKLEDGYVRTPLEELIRWRLWNRTGGGLMAELGSHQLDASGIFCSAVRKDGKKAKPMSVTAVGTRSIFGPNRGEVDDHVFCTYEYPGPDFDKDPNKKIVVTYSSIEGNGFGGYGEIVMGTKGTLILEQEREVMLYPAGGTTTSVKVGKAKDGSPTLDTTQSGGGPAVAVAGKGNEAPPSRGYTEEIEHWAWCIRNFDYENNRPKCHPEAALADAVIALTSNIAIREQRRIEFKDEWFKIDSDETPEGAKPSIAV
jgi:predicted dehydrogenase